MLFRSQQAPGQFPAVLFGIRARGCHNIPQSLAKKGLRATELVRAGVDIANRSTRRRREAIRTMDEKDGTPVHGRSEEHTSELQSLMRISYAVFCLKKQNNNTHKN